MLREKRYNVEYWNLHERNLRRSKRSDETSMSVMDDRGPIAIDTLVKDFYRDEFYIELFEDKAWIDFGSEWYRAALGRRSCTVGA